MINQTFLNNNSSNITSVLTRLQNIVLSTKRPWDIWDISLVILLIIGIIGNTLVIIVMRTSKHLRQTNAALFLTCMAIADMLVLFCKCLINIQKIYKIPIYNLCVLTLIIPDIAALISYYLIIITTIERTVAVLKPLKVAQMFSRKRCIICILIMICVFIAINSTKSVCLEYFHVQPAFCKIKGNTTQSCYLYLNIVFPWIQSALMSWIPSFLGILFNSIIIVSLYKASKKRKLMSFQSYTRPSKYTVSNKTTDESNTSFIFNTKSNPTTTASTLSKERQITIMLCTVSVVFVSLTLPYATFELLRKLNVHPIFRNRSFHRAVLLLLDCLHATNFVLYCLTGKKFRNELHHLFMNFFCMELFRHKINKSQTVELTRQQRKFYKSRKCSYAVNEGNKSRGTISEEPKSLVV